MLIGIISIVLLLLTICLVNILGWHSIAFDQKVDRPWNWRVLLGPECYYPWLDRRKKLYD